MRLVGSKLYYKDEFVARVDFLTPIPSQQASVLCALDGLLKKASEKDLKTYDAGYEDGYDVGYGEGRSDSVAEGQQSDI